MFIQFHDTVKEQDAKLGPYNCDNMEKWERERGEESLCLQN